MGGFASAFGDMLGKFGSKVETKIVPEMGPIVKRAIIENVAPMETAFKQSKAGNFILDAWNKEYRPMQAKIESEATAAAAKNAPLMDAKGVQLIEPHQIRVHARNTAREQAFGKKDEDLAYLLSQAKKEKGDIHANILADHLGVQFHDSAYQDSKHVGRANRLSRNLFQYAKRGGKDAVELSDSFIPKNTAPYTAPGKGEAKAKKYMLAALAPHAAIPHSVSSLITFLADGAVPYTKAVASAIPFHNYEDTRMLLKGTNAIAELHSLEYNQHFEYEQSKFKKFLNDKFQWVPDSVGEIIHSNRSMPGMSAVRKWNLTVAGMSAKFQAEEMAARLMHGDTYAESELKRFKLDPDKIRAQGGHLAPEDLRTAIFHGADYSAFLENSMQRTQFSQATVMGRTSLALHTYITRSSRAIKGSLMKEIAAKNPAGIARVLGTLILIAPEIGNGLQMIENVAHGKNWKDSYKEWDEEEGKLHGRDGFISFLTSHIDAISHLGAFGVATGYTRAMSRNKLMDTLAGPLPNMAVSGVEDTYKLGADITNYFLNGEDFKSGPAKQEGRDILNDIPSMGMGGVLSHTLLPTRNEVNASKPKTAKQIKAAQTRAMHKKRSN